MLHLWADMLHCELYRLAFQTHSEPRVQALFLTAPPGWLDQTKDLCVYSARNMVETFKMVENDLGDDGWTILDPSLSMLCYASMKIQLLYSSARDPIDLEEDPARDEMVENFRVLLVMVERLSRYFRPAGLLVYQNLLAVSCQSLMYRCLAEGNEANITAEWIDGTVEVSDSLITSCV